MKIKNKKLYTLLGLLIFFIVSSFIVTFIASLNPIEKMEDSKNNFKENAELFKENPKIASSTHPATYLPRIYCHEDEKDTLIALCYKKFDDDYWDYRIQVSLVWSDEDYPCNSIVNWDSFYDTARLLEYGTLIDIETFEIYILDDKIGCIYFYGSWSDDHDWKAGASRWAPIPVHHGSKKYYLEHDPVVEGPFKLYINTWNHLMSIERTDDEDDYDYLSVNKEYLSRNEAENEYRGSRHSWARGYDTPESPMVKQHYFHLWFTLDVAKLSDNDAKSFILCDSEWNYFQEIFYDEFENAMDISLLYPHAYPQYGSYLIIYYAIELGWHPDYLIWTTGSGGDAQFNDWEIFHVDWQFGIGRKYSSGVDLEFGEPWQGQDWLVVYDLKKPTGRDDTETDKLIDHLQVKGKISNDIEQVEQKGELIFPKDIIDFFFQDDDTKGPKITIRSYGAGLEQNSGYWLVQVSDESGISRLKVYIDNDLVNATTYIDEKELELVYSIPSSIGEHDILINVTDDDNDSTFRKDRNISIKGDIVKILDPSEYTLSEDFLSYQGFDVGESYPYVSQIYQNTLQLYDIASEYNDYDYKITSHSFDVNKGYQYRLKFHSKSETHGDLWKYSSFYSPGIGVAIYYCDYVSGGAFRYYLQDHVNGKFLTDIIPHRNFGYSEPNIPPFPPSEQNFIKEQDIDYFFTASADKELSLSFRMDKVRRYESRSGWDSNHDYYYVSGDHGLLHGENKLTISDLELKKWEPNIVCTNIEVLGDWKPNTPVDIFLTLTNIGVDTLYPYEDFSINIREIECETGTIFDSIPVDIDVPNDVLPDEYFKVIARITPQSSGDYKFIIDVDVDNQIKELGFESPVPGELTVDCQFESETFVVLEAELPTDNGTNVEIVDPNTDAQIIFDNVVNEGVTTVTYSNIQPEPPVSFSLAGNYYNVTTTAGFSGNITIIIPYDEEKIQFDEEKLRLKHWDGTEWIDITWKVDVDENVVYGICSEFSIFAVMEPIDIFAPSSTVSLSGDQGLNDWFKSDVLITLGATDDLSGVDEIFYRFNLMEWNSYSNPIDFSIEGASTFYYYSIDNFGNEEEIKSYDIKIDKTKPETDIMLTGTEGFEDWFTSNVEVTFEATDSHSGIYLTEYRINGGEWAIFDSFILLENEGISYLDYRSVDYAGNIEDYKTKIIKIDKTFPLTFYSVNPEVPNGNNGWYVSDVTVFLNGYDDISGFTSTEYRIDGGPWMPYSTPFTISKEGLTTIFFQSFDVAGNVENCQFIYLYIDKTDPYTFYSVNPEVPNGNNGWYVSDVTVFLNGYDDISGFTSTEYRIDGGTWLHYSLPFTISKEGLSTIEYCSYDVAGNEEDYKTFTLIIDKTAPVSSHLLTPEHPNGENGWYVSDVTITLSGTDSISNIASTRYRIDGGPWMPYSTPFTISKEELSTIDYRSYDIAGNMEDFKTITFNIDKTDPFTALLIDPANPNGNNGWYISDLDITLISDDLISGVMETYYQINGGPIELYSGSLHFSVDGTYTIEYWSKDKAGNVESINEFEFKIDQTNPKTYLTLLEPFNGVDPTYITTETLFVLHATDNFAGSGIGRIEYQIDDGAWQLYSSRFNIETKGSHAVSYRSIDLAGNVGAESVINVVANATTLTYIGEIGGIYSDPILLEALLIDKATLLPIPDKTITFTIGTQTISAKTSLGGIAYVNLVLNQPSGIYTVFASFSNDNNYLSSCDDRSFMIYKEKAYLKYTGSTVVPTTIDSITLRATVFDEDDGYWGDLNMIYVNFTIYSDTFVLVDTYGPFMVEVTNLNGVGVVEIEIPNLKEGNYLVMITFSLNSNNHYQGADTVPTAIVVYEPSGDFVTGGGWIEDSNGNKMNFGFNVKYKKNGLPKGQAIYIYEEGDMVYIVKANAWLGMAIIQEENHAFFEAKCTIQIYNSTSGELFWDEGNYQLRIDVWDENKDGGVDAFQIRVYDKIGLVYYEAGFDPYGILQGGNIVIHTDEKK